MFRSLLDRRRRLRCLDDEGFTLLEIVVALAILAVVATASLGFILTGYRGATTAKMDTVGRNLAQATLERLHNLPYHIAADVSSSQDLLDLYYPNATGTAGRGATGYVPAAGTRYTTDGDPSSGAFYRTVTASISGFAGYSQYVTVQFLNTDGTTVPPVSGWSAGTIGSDKPASNQVAVTVTTFWKTTNVSHKYTAYTQISAGRPAVPRINLQGRLTALTVTGALPSGNQLTLTGADLDINGSLGNTSSATASLTGAAYEIAGGQHTVGAAINVAAPPNVASSTASDNGSSITDNGTTVAAYAGNSVGGAAAGTVSGQPYIGSASSPAYSQLSSSGFGTVAAAFSNEPNNAHLGLGSTNAVVQVPNACGGCAAASVQGYATSTSSSSTHTATAAGTMSTGGGGTGSQSYAITLFPTASGGNGVVQIALASASVSCQTSGTFGSTSTGTASVTYQAYLRYIQYNNGSYTWSPWVSMNGGGSDPLANVDMTTQVGVDATGQPILLGDYIASWSSLTSSAVSAGQQISTDGKAIRGSYSLLAINTQPLRTGDAASGVGISLGSLTCTAEDNR